MELGEEKMRRYVLNARGAPVEEPDIHKWVEWYHETAKTDARVVATFPGGNDPVSTKVSTVFLGVDAYGDGRLWETSGAVSGSLVTWLCGGSRGDAVQQHLKMVGLITGKGAGC